jgi:hypothetical protein
MKVDFQQAGSLNEALSPYPFPSLEWLPLEEIRNIKKEDRYETAISLLNSWKQQKLKQKQIEKSKNSSSFIKGMEVVMIIWVIFSFLTSFLALPPATFFIAYYCTFLSTDSYSPVLIGCLMTLVLSGPIWIVRKYLERKA